MQVMVSAPTRSLVLPKNAETDHLFPHGKAFDWQGASYIQVPHRVSEARLLRNLGFDVPSPILTHYDWRGLKPFDVQKRTVDMLTLNPRAYVLNGMGTGKTKSALWAADYLMKQGEIQRVLILAPLSTLRVVWQAEILRTLPGRTFRVLHGTREQRRAMLAEDVNFYILNHDATTMLEEDILAKPGIDLVIIDELSVLRNSRTNRWDSTEAILKGRPWVWGLTGSPTPQSPLDAWGQARLVTPERVDRFVSHFRERVMQRVSNFTWAARPGHAEIVAEALRPSVRFRMEDVMELPPISYQRREVVMSPKASKAYKELINQYRSQVTANASITAANEGVMVNKLLQVSCGIVYDDASKVQDLGDGDRYTVLKEVLESNDRKVLVFCAYLHVLDKLVARLKKDGFDVASIHGGTPSRERDTIFDRFEKTPFIRVIAAHPRTMAHGINLTRANTVVWYNPAPSYEIYEQANARVRRPGQTSKQLVLELAASHAERQCYKRLRSKETMQGTILALLHGENDG